MEVLRTSWETFCDRATRCKSVAEVRLQADGGANGGVERGAASMKKVLGAVDLTMLGIGGIIGAGVFVTTGVAARGKETSEGTFDGAGPAVIISFAISSVVAFLCALCYTEFATAVPVAGGAYVYVTLTFGELAAWIVGANLLLEYTLSSAAVARGWTSYLAETMQMEPSSLRLKLGGMEIDFPAAIVIIGLTALLAKGIREGAVFNAIITGVNLAVILVILGVGFANGNSDNFVPFTPNGWPAISAAASVVFFSFIGFDTVASTAEEVKNPSRDLPVGILASLGICTLLYMAMSLALAGLTPWDALDVDAPFGQAFRQSGMAWVDSIVSVGALTGITTSLLVSLVGGARVLVTLSRDRLVPFHMSLAQLHIKHQTPHISQWTTGVCSAGVALLIDIELLARMVNIGTLFVFFSVSAAVLARRYSTSSGGVQSTPANKYVVSRLIMLSSGCIAFSIAANLQAPIWVLVLSFTAMLLSAMTFLRLEQLTQPQQFRTPMVPFIPAAAMAGSVWLIGSLGGLAFLRFAIWCALSLLIYIFYGMFRTSEAFKEQMVCFQTAAARDVTGGLPASSSSPSFWDDEGNNVGDAGDIELKWMGDDSLATDNGPPAAASVSSISRFNIGRSSDRLTLFAGASEPNFQDHEREHLNPGQDSAPNLNYDTARP